MCSALRFCFLVYLDLSPRAIRSLPSKDSAFYSCANHLREWKKLCAGIRLASPTIECSDRFATSRSPPLRVRASSIATGWPRQTNEEVMTTASELLHRTQNYFDRSESSQGHFVNVG